MHSWGDADGDDVTIKVRLSNLGTKADMVYPIKELDTDWRAYRTAFTLHCTRIPVLPLLYSVLQRMLIQRKSKDTSNLSTIHAKRIHRTSPLILSIHSTPWAPSSVSSLNTIPSHRTSMPLPNPPPSPKPSLVQTAVSTPLSPPTISAPSTPKGKRNVSAS